MFFCDPMKNGDKFTACRIEALLVDLKVDMKLLLDIVLTLALLMWPLLMMMSPMLFGAPGSEDSKSGLVFLLLIIFYPVIIFSCYKMAGASYFRFSTNHAWLWSAGLTMFVAVLFGYPRHIMNVIAGVSGTGYFVKEDKVYHNGKIMAGASAATFKTIGTQYPRYARDEKRVYFDGRLIANADAASFTGVSNPSTQAGEKNSPLFWKDKTHVYLEGHALPGANPAEFRHLGGRYGSDARQVYFDKQVLQGANPATFQLFNADMARDDKQIYIFDKVGKLAGPVSAFRLLSEQDLAVYGTDGIYVYAVFFTAAEPLQIVKDADPATFKILERAYSRDDKHIYYRDSSPGKVILLEDADAGSFVTGYYDAATKSDAHDHFRYYLNGKLVTTKK